MKSLKDRLRKVLTTQHDGSSNRDCLLFEVNPPNQYLNTVSFVTIEDFGNFVKSQSLCNVFHYVKFGKVQDFIISKTDMFNYCELDMDGEQEVEKYNSYVAEVDFTVPIEEGIFIVIGEFVYLYTECPNQYFKTHEIEDVFKKLDFFANGGKAV